MIHRRVYWIWTVFFLLILSCGGGGGGPESKTAPAAPQNVVSSSGNTKSCLSWGNSIDATTYNIYWSTTAGVRKQTGTKISAVASPYYHTGLTNDTPYYYVVTAANQYGESSESLEVSATPGSLNPPLPPSDVATLAGDRNVIIRWTAQEVSDTTASHNIYWSTSTGVTKETGIKIPGVTNPYTHNDLINGTTYYYVVTGVNQYGEGRISREVSAMPDQGNVPSAPTGLSATAGDRQSVINWTAVSGAASYNLFWSTSSDISSRTGTKIADVTSRYTHTGLTQNATYYYVVTAVNGYGESADSAKASVTIPNNLQDICVAMGDSITKGAPWPDNDSDFYVPRLETMWGKTVINEGSAGAKSSNGAALVDEVLTKYNPKYLTIYYGNNDIGFYSTDSIIANLRYMIQRAKSNGTLPVIATLGPFLGDWAWRQPYATDLNQRIRKLAASEGISCADLEAAFGSNPDYMVMPDGMHPNAAGHGVIANTFYNILK
jgi:lysophospholipase L1-like esterase